MNKKARCGPLITGPSLDITGEGDGGGATEDLECQDKELDLVQDKAE